MNDAQRAVLQRHKKSLADDIMLTEELIDVMLARKLFEPYMIETIRAEKTHTDQLYKMLSILPRRGPEAFDTFIDILRAEYQWLAAMLEEKYKQEIDILTLNRQSSLVSMCTCGSQSARADLTSAREPAIGRGEAQADGPCPSYTTRPPVQEIPADSDVKTRVGMFIHKQFGHSKRISQQDKKAMERWLNEQIQTERKMRASQSSSISEEPPDISDSVDAAVSAPTVACQPAVNEDLRRLFNKVQDENLSDLLNSEYAHKPSSHDGAENGSDEGDSRTSNNSLEDMDKFTDRFEREVDMLINRMNEMEGMLTQCYYILGDPDRKRRLTDLVKDVQYSSKQHEKELRGEKIKSEKMLNELYEYSKQINRLEVEREHNRQQNDKLKEEVERLRRENAVVRDKCEKLEEANMKHIEKEKTLQNLKKMVDDLRTSKTSGCSDESPNFRAVGGGSVNGIVGNMNSRSRRLARVPNRKGSTADLSMSNTGRSRNVTRTNVVNARNTRRTLQINKFGF